MLEVLFQVIEIAAATIAVAFLVGYAPSRILLPRKLRSREILLVPMIGIALTIVAGGIIDSYLMPLRQGAWILLASGGLADVAIIAWRRRLTLFGERRDSLAAASLAIVVMSLGVAPLFHYGYVSTIGPNWDPEIYLPLADLIARYRVGDFIRAASNPVVPLLNEPDVRGGAGWGFSYLQAIIDVITGQPAYVTFSVLNALLTALQMVSAWVLFRWLGSSFKEALLAGILLGFNGLVLWIDYFGFGGQVVVFALLPTALVLVLAAFDDHRWTSAVLAGAVVASLMASYYTAIVPILGLPLAVAFIRRFIGARARLSLLTSGAIVAVASFLLSAEEQLAFLKALKYVHAVDLTSGPGITEFVPLGVGLGAVDPFGKDSWLALGAVKALSQDLAIVEIAATVLMVLLAGLALYRRHSADLIAIALSYTTFLIYLIKINPYPYGYFKTLALIAFVSALLVAIGLSEVVSLAGHTSQALRRAVIGLASVLLLLVVSNGLAVATHYMERGPGLYSQPLLELAKVRDLIPVGSSVYVTGSGGVQGPAMGFISYVLLGQRVYGNVHTGYSTYSELCQCNLTGYALLTARESVPPQYLGYKEIWRNSIFRLLRRPKGLVYNYAGAKDSPLFAGQQRSMTVGLGDDHGGGQPRSTAAQNCRDYDIVGDLMSVTPSTISVSLGQQSRDIELTPGDTKVTLLTSVCLPGLLTVRVREGGPAWVRDIGAWEAGKVVQTCCTVDRNLLYIAWRSSADSGKIHTHMQYTALGAAQSIGPAIDIYGSGGQHYGWWSFNLNHSGQMQALDFRLDPISKKGRMLLDGHPTGGSSVDVTGNGHYQASLFLWKQGKVWRTVPIFTFTIAGGELVQFEPKSGRLITLVSPP